MRIVFRWVSVGIGFTLVGCDSTESDPGAKAIADSNHADAADAAAATDAAATDVAAESQATADAGAESQAASSSSGGNTSNTSDTDSAGGSFNVGGASGNPGAAGKPNVPKVDPEVSAEYRWTECGRIAGTSSQPTQTLYAVDGSVLILHENGRVLLYDSSSTAPRTLVEPVQELTDSPYMALSRDGRYLAVRQDANLGVYASSDGAPIGADAELLEASTLINYSTSPCLGAAAFSSNAELLVASSNRDVCLWDVASGQLSTLDLADRGVSVGVAVGANPLRVLHELTPDSYELRTYTLLGELTDSFDLSLLPGDLVVLDAAFSPDAEVLLVLVRPVGAATPLEFVAIETDTGTESWRRSLNGALSPQLILSNDGYALVGGDAVYRINDGELVAQDSVFSQEAAALAPEGLRKLLLGSEFVTDLELSDANLARHYGSHTVPAFALDISRDGRYLASHGQSAMLWELAPEFAASRALMPSQDASFTSWNVTIAADGSAMLTNGSSVALFRRDGSYQLGWEPPAEGECWGDWSLSPRGTVMAGNRVDQGLQVLDARDLSLLASLPADNCTGGVAFSPDGSLLVTASLELFETETWTRVWNTPPVSLPTDPIGPLEHAVEFSPDGQEVVITQCQGQLRGAVCSSARYATSDAALLGEVLELEGDRVRYSPEGHWLVSRNRVVHLPSAASQEYALEATVATFTPDGDIIAGSVDGSLVRYCRDAQ